MVACARLPIRSCAPADPTPRQCTHPPSSQAARGAQAVRGKSHVVPLASPHRSGGGHCVAWCSRSGSPFQWSMRHESRTVWESELPGGRVYCPRLAAHDRPTRRERMRANVSPGTFHEAGSGKRNHSTVAIVDGQVETGVHWRSGRRGLKGREGLPACRASCRRRRTRRSAPRCWTRPPRSARPTSRRRCRTRRPLCPPPPCAPNARLCPHERRQRARWTWRGAP